ncbi:MAG TPA: hypothetical protein ENH87_04055 [Pricia antarctica]|uniref:DUF6973 domain-containing protein n=1 Tax=Pricia antarctica TaxID=641691 RepID=A0A831VLW5_9FLAO|nr:hypothetical protein [Pricia antarctica]
MKAQFYIRFIFLFSLIVLFGCQEEDDLDTEPQNSKASEINEQDLPKDYSKSTAALNEMQSDTRLGTIVQELFGEKNFNDGMTKMSKKNKLKIDTTSVLKIEHDGNTTFTLQAHRNEEVDSLFYNVVLNIYADGSTEIFGLTYKMIELLEDGSFIYDGPLNAFPVKSEDLSAKMNCFQVIMDVCGYGGTYHSAGPNCTPSYLRPDVQTICVYEGPGNVRNQPNNHPKNNGQGTYTGGGSNNSRTSPVNNNDDPDDYIRKKVNEFDVKVGLTQLQKDYLILNKKIGLIRDLEIFLIENSSSSDSKAFVRNLIESIRINNYTTLYRNKIFLQDPYDVWGTLSQKEKDLIKSFPIDAYNIFKNRPIAEQATRMKFGRNGLNDKSDAFRHAYFNALNARSVGKYDAKLFSDAHESEVPNQLLKEKEMDLFNNNVGHSFATGFPNISNPNLANEVYKKITDGSLRYLSPINSSDSNFRTTHGITTTTKLIPTNR